MCIYIYIYIYIYKCCLAESHWRATQLAHPRVPVPDTGTDGKPQAPQPAQGWGGSRLGSQQAWKCTRDAALLSGPEKERTLGQATQPLPLTPRRAVWPWGRTWPSGDLGLLFCPERRCSHWQVQLSHPLDISQPWGGEGPCLISFSALVWAGLKYSQSTHKKKFEP